MKVRDILNSKGPEVFTISQDKSLAEAMRTLVNNHVGVLLVLNANGESTGIISERDVLRAANAYPEDFSSKLVRDFMTQKVIVVEPEDELSYVEQVMTENRIRHLPVMSKQKLSGLISIGDVVKSQLKNYSSENKYLIDYISGNVK